MKKILTLVVILVSLASSAFGQRVLTLLEPVGLETWVTGSHDVRWERTGSGWTASDTINIEYSDDSGTDNYEHTVTPAAPANADRYPWDITPMPISPYYRVRITCNQEPSATSQSTTDFRIGNLAFYVNDGSAANDKWCTAAGTPLGNGLSPSTPNTSVQYIIDHQNLEAGDIIYVDTGTYPLTANIVVGAADGGVSGNPVRFVGATENLDGTGARLAVLDRNAAGTSTSRVIEVTGSYVRLENLCMTRGYYGISLTGTGAEARNCEVYANGNTGVNLAGTANSATNCLVRNNSGTGIGGSGAISGNTVRDTTGTGISASGTISGNTVENSTARGISCSVGYYVSSAITGNTVRNSTGDGIYAGATDSGATVTMANNLTVNNGAVGINMYTTGSGTATVTAINNTMADNVSHGACYNRSGYGSCNFQNNIVHTDGAGKVCFYIQSSLSGAFDYNTYYSAGGASTGYYSGAARLTPGEWRAATGQDTHSLDCNPMFVDLGAGDYHLLSTAGSWHGGSWLPLDAVSSPCIDAGQPDTTPPYDYALEPAPNGSRINQGAYGGTAQASKMPVERVLTLLEPQGGEAWISGPHAIRWNRSGQAWTGSETLTVEYSPDSGATWTVLNPAANAAAGTLTWNVTGLTPRPFYRVRITCNQDSPATDTSADFRVGNLTFYVNDASMSNDKDCTAPGDVLNDGLSPGTPKDSAQAIIDTYNLEGGDVVYIDTGTYPLAANIVVGPGDGGASGNPVRFVGATETDGTRLALLDRNAAGTSASRVIEVTGDYVRLENLCTMRGYYGISLTGTGAEARNCEVYANGNTGVNLAGTANSATNCLVRNNSGTGIGGSGTISGNTVRGTTGTGISASGTISGNTVENSTARGISCSVGYYVSSAITGNTVRNSTGDGIYAAATDSGAAVTLLNNLIVNNGAVGINMYTTGSGTATVTAINNTMADNVSHGAYYNRSGYGSCNFRNNIVHTDGAGKVCFYIQSSLSGAFDYNTYHTASGAGTGYYNGATRPTLGEWRTTTGQDANSLPYDPLFVDPANGDYHVMSTEGSCHDGLWLDDAQNSPTIDAGQPDSIPPFDYDAEPCPNGSRINQGFDGGTAQASKSLGTHPTVVSATAITLRTIDIAFSLAMDPAKGVLVPANYTLSGAGMGNLTAHPDSVALRSGNTYTLTWNMGEMRDGAIGTVTVTPVENVQDVLCYHVDDNANSAPFAGLGVLPDIITVNPLTTRSKTPLLSGTLHDVDSGICGCQVTVNGHTYTATVNGTNWAAQVADILPAGTFDVDARATDCAGNSAQDPTSDELTIDPGHCTTDDAIVATDPMATNLQTVHFMVYFSMHVENVSASGFKVDASGGVTQAMIIPPVQEVPGTDKTQWTVTVNTGTGDGTLGIDLADGNSIVDSDGYPVCRSSNRQFYQIDKTAPIPTITRSDPSVTDLDTVTYTITFSEPVRGFATPAVEVGGSLAGQSAPYVSGGPAVFQVQLSLVHPEDDGTLYFSILSSIVSDLAGNLYGGGASPVYRISNWHGFTWHPMPEDLQLYVGQSHTYQVLCSYGNSPVAYQWKKDGAPQLGETGSSFAIAHARLQDAGSYRCEARYDGFTYPSNDASLTVAEHLTITEQPDGGSIPVGKSYSFRVQTTGGFDPPTYTWKKDGVVIAGATESSYTIASLMESDAGSYMVEVADNLTDVVQSNPAVLTVPPSDVPAIGFSGMAALVGTLVFLGSRMALRRGR